MSKRVQSLKPTQKFLLGSANLTVSAVFITKSDVSML